MFNMGLGELIFVGIIALIFIGPKQLPEVARNLARFFNELKRTTGEFKKNFQGLDTEFKSAVNDVNDMVRDTEGWAKKKIAEIADVEGYKEEEPPRFGHVDNPNHISSKMSSNETQKKMVQEGHEGFVSPIVDNSDDDKKS